MLGGLLETDTRRGRLPATALRIGYYAQEHETLDVDRTILEHMRSAAPEPDGQPTLRRILGAFPVLPETTSTRWPAVPLGAAKRTRLALRDAGVFRARTFLLLDETDE